MSAWVAGHRRLVGVVIAATFLIGLISLPFVGGGGGHHNAGQRVNVVTGPPTTQALPSVNVPSCVLNCKKGTTPPVGPSLHQSPTTAPKPKAPTTTTPKAPPTTPTTKAAPKTTPTTAAPPPLCTSDQLRARTVAANDSTGSSSTIYLRNTGAVCALDGFPDVTLFDSDGSQSSAGETQDGSTPGVVVLAANQPAIPVGGAAGYATVVVSSPTLGGTCSNSETPATLTVDLPGGAEIDGVALAPASDGSSFMVCSSAYTVSPVK